MPRDRVTCGVLFRKSLEEATGFGHHDLVIFAKGHMCGQAEKVHIGACRGAMFRPSEEHYKWLLAYAGETAENYGLHVVCLDDEIWLARDNPTVETLVRLGETVEENSSEWHEIRAAICGVPQDEVDRTFHLRVGSGEKADA